MFRVRIPTIKVLSVLGVGFVTAAFAQQGGVAEAIAPLDWRALGQEPDDVFGLALLRRLEQPHPEHLELGT